MREIKFRIWDKETKIMEMVGAIDWESTCNEIITCNTPTTKLYFGYHDDLNPILMQFTGLKDKNGKEIYEGDFLARDGYWNIRIDYYQGCFYVNSADKIQYINKILECPIGRFPIEYYEVIGNIYENPELLEGGK